MTPKEKAKNLIFRYEQYKWINKDLAKQCALIAVDEIINALRKDLPEIGLGKGFWHDVKTEINAL